MRRLPVLFLIALSATALGYADPFLPGLELGADIKVILTTMEEAGWTVEDHFDHITERFIVEGRMEGRLLRYAYDRSERFDEAVYAEPHPPDETRTAAYGAWLDVLTETFGEPEVVNSFHHWEVGGYVVDIGAEEFDFGDGYPAPVVLIAISRRD